MIIILHSLIPDCFRNEEEVGSALKKCGIPREEIYVTTKVCSLSRVAKGRFTIWMHAAVLLCVKWFLHENVFQYKLMPGKIRDRNQVTSLSLHLGVVSRMRQALTSCM